jgi:hypothetical protein
MESDPTAPEEDTSMKTSTRISTSLAVAAMAASLLAPTAALAGGNTASTTGRCAGATLKMKARPEVPNRVGVDFEVNGRPGQRWVVSLFDNQARIHHGVHTVGAVTHSFAVHKVTRNRPGADVVRFRATRLATGQACTGRVRL